MHKLFLACLLTAPFFLNAQTLSQWVISPGGGYGAVAGTTELNYTVGQQAIRTYNAGSVFLTQGFQQPLPKVATATPEPIALGAALTLYPNPADEEIHLAGDLPYADVLHLTLLDARGAHVRTYPAERIAAGQVARTLSLNGLAAGIYLLRVQYATPAGPQQHTYKFQRLH